MLEKRHLEGLPLLSAAATQGELGCSKLRATTRIATSENEADFDDTVGRVKKFMRLSWQAERVVEPGRAGVDGRAGVRGWRGTGTHPSLSRGRGARRCRGARPGHSERIAYKHAVMVTMHAWRSKASLPDTVLPKFHEVPPAQV